MFIVPSNNLCAKGTDGGLATFGSFAATPRCDFFRVQMISARFAFTVAVA